MTLLDKMDQDIYDSMVSGLDIANFINTKEDVLVLAQLIKQAIEKEKKDFSTLPEEQDLWNFHHTLLKYAQELTEKL